MTGNQERGRTAALVDFGGAAVFGMMGTLMFVKAGKAGSMFEDMTKGDALPAFLICGVFLLAAILVRLKPRVGGLLGTLLFAMATVGLVVKLIAKGNAERTTILAVIFLAVMAIVHSQIWLGREERTP